MEKRMVLHVALVGLATLALPSNATVGAQSQAPDQVEETTVAGCLQTVADAGGFVLVAEDKQTYQIQAAESVELAPHANHRVELTGTVEKTETSTVLKATALKMVASSCEV